MRLFPNPTPLHRRRHHHTTNPRLVSLQNANVQYLTKEELDYDKRGPEDMDGTLKPMGDVYKIHERVGHPLGLYSKLPRWWYKWGTGMAYALFQDEVYLRAREDENLIEARRFVERDGIFKATCEEAFVEFHLDDASRPVELRTMNVGKFDVLLRQIRFAVSAVWERCFDDTAHRYNISYLKDEFVFHFLMKKCAAAAGDGLKTLEGFTKFVKSMFNEAGVMRKSVLCQHHQEYLDRTRGERENAARDAELAAMAQEAKDFDIWVAKEEARLNKLKLANKLDDYQLGTVEKRAKEKEWKEKLDQNEIRKRELLEGDMAKIEKKRHIAAVITQHLLTSRFEGSQPQPLALLMGVLLEIGGASRSVMDIMSGFRVTCSHDIAVRFLKRMAVDYALSCNTKRNGDKTTK